MNLAKFYLRLCIACLFVHIGRKAILSYVGIDPTYGFSLIGIVFLLLAIHQYHRRYGAPPGAIGHFILIGIFAILVGMLTVTGYFRGNLIRNIFYDSWVFLFIALCLIAGRYEQFWKDLHGPMLLVFWLGYVVVFVSLRRSTVDIEYTGVSTGEAIRARDTRSAVESLGYDLQTFLSFWPVLFVLGYQERRVGWHRMLGLATAPAYLALQIIFLKRAPAVRVLTYVVVAVLASAVLQRRLRAGSAILAGAGVVIGIFLAGEIYIHQLRERFERAETTARYAEAESLLRDLSGIEWVLGRGMGGAFTPPLGWTAGTTYINYLGERGRTGLHVGLLMPMLKGGIVLMIVYYLFFFRVFWFKPPGWSLIPENFVAKTVVPVYFLFLLIEGPPSVGDPFTCMLVGLCCARASVQTEPQVLPLEHTWGEQRLSLAEAGGAGVERPWG